MMKRLTMFLCLGVLLHCSLVGAGEKPPAEIVDYTQVDPKELGVEPVVPRRDPATNFLVGGKNATESLAGLTSLNGRAIADLERDMRPNAMTDVGSTSGFLGPDESLLQILAADNKYVVDDLRLTHQEVARHLRVLAALGMRHAGEEFLYRGQRFRVTLKTWRGYQMSPFRDGTRTNQDANVENLTIGEHLEFSLLVPLMIERYGFYEGKGTPYRVDPVKALRVLGFVPKGA